MEQLVIAGMECSLFLPEKYEENRTDYPVIYVNGDVPLEEILEQMEKRREKTEFLMISVKARNWGRDFTPWKAEAIRKEETPPEGKADDYIKVLVDCIKPYMDTHYRTKTEPEKTILLGYSLGGLAAVYTICKTACFGKVGSLSGSLWYDGFIDYLDENIGNVHADKVYFSLGKKEPKSRNIRMGKVGVCTEQAQRLFEKRLGEENVCLEWNNGGHFDDIGERFAKAISWLMQEKTGN